MYSYLVNMYGVQGLRDGLILQPSPLLISDEYLGVEVELEQVNRNNNLDESLWEEVEDGSLRNNGMEYKFKRPMFGQDVINALENLQNTIIGCDISYRCSVHVHLDVTNMLEDQLKQFYSILLLYEPSLYAYFGDVRTHNIYTVPFSHQGVVTTISDPFHNVITSQTDRYAGTNLRAAQQFGSFEFRHHPGTDDFMSLVPWLNIILSLKELAMKQEDLFEYLIKPPVIKDLPEVTMEGKLNMYTYINEVTGRWVIKEKPKQNPIENLEDAIGWRNGPEEDEPEEDGEW